MNIILKTMASMVGRGLLRQRRLQTLKTGRTEKMALKLKEETQKRIRTIEQIRRYPLYLMSKTELSVLPKGSEVDLKSCPLGTWFICNPCDYLPGVVIVGQLVAGRDMFCEQWGAGLSVPGRGINRHWAVICSATDTRLPSFIEHVRNTQSHEVFFTFSQELEQVPEHGDLNLGKLLDNAQRKVAAKSGAVEKPSVPDCIHLPMTA